MKILMDLKHGITGKDVLIVEDVVDSGNQRSVVFSSTNTNHYISFLTLSGLTLKYLMELLAARMPKTLRVCVLTRVLHNADASYF